ncbi:MAG TPA: hypothetical protein VH599_17015 [Ktedonobacterales bacterium]|jgi:hypothetical protein
MSPASTAFAWGAPVPQPFTRCSGPTFWPGDRRYRPLDWSFRRVRDLTFLTEALPAALTAILRERFKPTRGPLRWETPPALPNTIRGGYEVAELHDFSEERIGAEITLTAGLIERLLEAPEGLVGGLTHNLLFAMQARRLWQLWEEAQRRDWLEAPLVAFQRALS